MADQKSSAAITMGSFIGLALIFGAAPLGTDMFLPSVPSITEELHATDAMTQLTISLFMLGMGVGQVVFGPISDSLGRRRLLISGTVLGLISSLICSVAPNIELLVAGRLFQGIAGGIGVVLVRAIITDRSKPAEAARGFGILMAINAIAPILAPLIGGLMHELTGWRGVFWTLVVIAVLQLLVALRNKESLPKERRSEGRVTQTYRRMGTLLRIPEFLGHVLIFGFGFGTMFAFISGSSVAFQSQLGLSPVGYSLAFALNASAIIIVSFFNVRLADVVDPRILQKIGVVLIAVGSVALLCVSLFVAPHVAGASADDPGHAPMWILALCLVCTVITTCGNGLMMASTTVIAQGLAAQYAGAGSAVLGAMQFIVAGVVSPVSVMGSDKLLTMAATMCVSAVIACLGNLIVVTARKKKAAA